MRNPEITPKEYDWVFCTVSSCVMIPASLLLLPSWLAVVQAIGAASLAMSASRLLGISRKLTNRIFLCLGIILMSIYAPARLHLVNIDLYEGRQNYFLVAAFLPLAVWELLRILVAKLKKSNQRMQGADRR